ncbi:MAG: hypothetical protein Q8N44_21040 [Rubrivivax sp.]|nr:hypothetical protein [Rubrivivax sp.]MDP3086162.1 hypothetical protein [Rubrivivax sp.]
MTIDAGVMLLSATERKLELLEAASDGFVDPRSPLGDACQRTVSG